MAILACTNIRYSIGTRVLLDGVSFSLDAGSRVGLVGRNGCGKTTLLRVLSGKQKPDSGIVSIAKGTRVGYLTQDPELDLNKTLRDEAASGFVALLRLHKELDEVFHQMALPENAEPDRLDRLLRQQDELQHQIEAMGGFAVDHKVDAVLHGLGFTDAQFGIQVGKLSGGQKGRLALAKLLLESPELLLLDEPTNHLDIAGCEWLEEFLVNEFPGAVLMISHDRYMLNNVVHRIEEIEAGRLIDYPGNYAAFTEIRKQRLLTQTRAYENQQSQWAKEEEFIRRFKAGQRAKEAQGRLSKLERQKELFSVERPVEMAAMRFGFAQGPRSGDQVAILREASKAYAHPTDEQTDHRADDGVDGKKVLFRDLNLTISRGERWGIIGPNGAGKTTLVKAILGQIDLDAGSAKIGANIVIGYYAQMPPDEDADTPVYQYLQKIIRRENPAAAVSEQQARDLAGAFLFSGQDQDKPLGVMSGGERSRARLAGLLASGKNLLVLDEPTNHLDIPSAERLELALTPGDPETGGEGGYSGTLLLISHDRALIDETCDHLIVLDGHGNATVFVGNYTEWHRKQGQIQADRAKQAAGRAPDRKAATAAAPPDVTRARVEAAEAESKWAAPAPSQHKQRSGKDTSRGGSNNHDRGNRSDGKEKPGGKGLGWMPMERLEKEIERLGKAIKEADSSLEREDVYRDAERCRKVLAERDDLTADLQRHEAEWMRRADNV